MSQSCINQDEECAGQRAAAARRAVFSLALLAYLAQLKTGNYKYNACNMNGQCNVHDEHDEWRVLRLS